MTTTMLRNSALELPSSVVESDSFGSVDEYVFFFGVRSSLLAANRKNRDWQNSDVPSSQFNFGRSPTTTYIISVMQPSNLSWLVLL